MTPASRTPWVATAFWIVSSIELALLAAWLWNFFVNRVRGQYDGLVAVAFMAGAVLLGGLMLAFALVHHPVFRGISLALVAIPSLSIGSIYAVSGLKILSTPGPKELRAGHGYFESPADRRLADAIVAGDAQRVAELAPAANLKAVGFAQMTFMQLALHVRSDADGRVEPAVVAALLKAGANPDDGQFLFGSLNAPAEDNLMIGQKNEPLLRAVLDAGVDLNHLDPDGRPRFFEALIWPEGLTLMLKRGANVEAEDNEGNTAILLAMQWRCWAAIDVLLANGARIDRVDHEGHGLRDALKQALASLGGPDAGVPPELSALAERLR